MTAEEALEYGLKFVILVLIPVIGYLFKHQRDSRITLFKRYDSIRGDFTAFQIQAAKDYMNKSEIRHLIETAIEPIKESLERIEKNQDKLLDERKT